MQVSKVMQSQIEADRKQFLKAQNESAFKLLEGKLETAKQEQTATLEQGTRLATVSTNFSNEQGKFFRSLLDILETAKKNDIRNYIAISLIDTALGEMDTLGDSKSAASVKSSRSSIVNFAIPLYADNFEDLADAAEVMLKDENGKERPITDLSTREVRAIIKENNSNAQQKQIRALRKELQSKITEALRGQALNKDKGTIALDAVPHAVMVSFLADCIKNVPARRPSSSRGVKDETTAETLSEALEASDESNHANAGDEGEANEGGAERAA